MQGDVQPDPRLLLEVSILHYNIQQCDAGVWNTIEIYQSVNMMAEKSKLLKIQAPEKQPY